MPHEPAPSLGCAIISLGFTCVYVVVAYMASEDQQVVSFAIANVFSALALVSLCLVSYVRVFWYLAVHLQSFLKIAYIPSVLARICLRVLCVF